MSHLEQIIRLTGLPENIIREEIISKAQDLGYDKENLSLDQLRHLIADYMRDVLVHLKDELQQTQ